MEKLKIIKSSDKGKIYECGKFNIIKRKKGTVSADHAHKEQEKLYLLDGNIELTIGNETKIIEIPSKIEIKPNEYHKIVAISDIILLEEKKGC